MPEPSLLLILNAAISAYDYPRALYDFPHEREQLFARISDLDAAITALLHSRDPHAVKDGLSNILYWGHYRTPYRDRRVRLFRQHVTTEHLQRAISTFAGLTGAGLCNLKALRLPEFSNMAFLSKLRTFLNPDDYCVLDQKISTITILNDRLKRQPTYIPVTAYNQRVYQEWVTICTRLAEQLNEQPTPQCFRPVDVERGLFQLIQQDRRNDANAIVAQAGQSAWPQ
jgi:hypothetical protein